MYIYAHCLFRLLFLSIIMRPSSLGGGRILRRTLSVRLSVCLYVCRSVPLSLPSVTSFRQPLYGKYQSKIEANENITLRTVLYINTSQVLMNE